MNLLDNLCINYENIDNQIQKLNNDKKIIVENIIQLLNKLSKKGKLSEIKKIYNFSEKKAEYILINNPTKALLNACKRNKFKVINFIQSKLNYWRVDFYFRKICKQRKYKVIKFFIKKLFYVVDYDFLKKLIKNKNNKIVKMITNNYSNIVRLSCYYGNMNLFKYCYEMNRLNTDGDMLLYILEGAETKKKLKMIKFLLEKNEFAPMIIGTVYESNYVIKNKMSKFVLNMTQQYILDVSIHNKKSILFSKLKEKNITTKSINNKNIRKLITKYVGKKIL